MAKIQEFKNAIALRKQGSSYREILSHIPVSKSTLSLWLRRIGLSKRQKQRLTQKKLEAGRRGAQAQRDKRLQITKEIKEKAKAEISHINNRELWLMGTMLYWAEGTKEKNDAGAVSVQFSNSDPFMIKLFLKWLFEICKVAKDAIRYEIYIHENNKYRLDAVRKYWAAAIGIKANDFHAIYFKKHKIGSNRKNIGKIYFGLLKIRVRKSSSLNRKITGWIEGINQYYCGVV